MKRPEKNPQSEADHSRLLADTRFISETARAMLEARDIQTLVESRFKSHGVVGMKSISIALDVLPSKEVQDAVRQLFKKTWSVSFVEQEDGTCRLTLI